MTAARPVTIPAATVPASRSYDGMDHIIPEQVIARRDQPRQCAWCAVGFVPSFNSSAAMRQRFCSKRCSALRAHHEQKHEPSQLRDVVLEQIGRLTPRMVKEIHERVVDVWGHVSERAVLRALAELRDAAMIRRTPDGYLLAPRKRNTITAATEGACAP